MINVIVAVKDSTKKFQIEYKEITLQELAESLNIGKENIGAIIVNDVPKRLGDKFEDNSTIYFLPIIQGG